MVKIYYRSTDEYIMFWDAANQMRRVQLSFDRESISGRRVSLDVLNDLQKKAVGKIVAVGQPYKFVKFRP